MVRRWVLSLLMIIGTLFNSGIHLVTGIRSNMKNRPMSLYDRIMFRKRSIIETVNDELNNICEVEHTRHRAVHNFVMNLISALAAYCFFDKNRLSAAKWNCRQDNAPFFTDLQCFFIAVSHK
jgi:hypothetical protein